MMRFVLQFGTPSLLGLAMLTGIPSDRTRPLSAEWSIEGSDLALWDVFESAGDDQEKQRPRAMSLGVFGHQVDRRAGARFPVHGIDDIAYDIALRVPLGRVRQDRKVRFRVRYDRLARHRPLDLLIVGRVTEVTESTFRFEAKLSGTPATRYAKEIHDSKPWIPSLTGEIETVFDCERGIMRTSEVTLEIRGRHKDEGSRDDAPEPRIASHGLRFRFRRIREHPGAEPEETWQFRASVGQAIVAGTSWLRESIRKDGTYGTIHFYHTFSYGETCFAALALLHCGAKRDDPFIIDLMDKIRRFPLKYTYELAVAMMAMEAFYTEREEFASSGSTQPTAPIRRQMDPDDLAWMRERAEQLLALANRRADGWTWGYKDEIPRPDLSNTQYAALGLLAAWRCGVAIPEEAWAGMAKGVLSHRVGSETAAPRGYGYEPGKGGAKASMTVGAIGTLRIAADILALQGSQDSRGRLGLQIEAAIREGWAWIVRNWCIQRQAPRFGRRWILYFLYGLERACVFERVGEVGDHDWYFEGAAWLLGTQEEDGHWDDEISGVHNTCFALLFLRQSTIPIPERTQEGK